MPRVFGQSYLSPFWQEPEPPRDPGLPDPEAVREMAVFDSLSPPARAAFREARQQFSASSLRGQIEMKGCPRAIAEGLRAEGRLPAQLGVDGILVLVVAGLDQQYTAQFYAEKERGKA
jgi:hypothetical protein